MERKENDSPLDVCLEVSVVEGRPSLEGGGGAINFKTNVSDLLWLSLSKN